MKTYKNFISLGYFCSVALDLERLGLRNCSSPFDWCISDFEGIDELIRTNFKDFLNYDDLYQSKDNHGIYRNIEYNISFIHDFDKYLPLDKQLPEIRKKYERRIARFYKNITEPTLFVRYISDEEYTSKDGKEIVWIESHYNQIISLLRSFNCENDIIFIANKNIISNSIPIYSVEKDENDVVARKPFDKNTELHSLFNSYDLPEKENNILVYERKIKKQKNQRNFIRRCLKKFYKSMLFFKKEYVHDKQI